MAARGRQGMSASLEPLAATVFFTLTGPRPTLRGERAIIIGKYEMAPATFFPCFHRSLCTRSREVFESFGQFDVREMHVETTEDGAYFWVDRGGGLEGSEIGQKDVVRRVLLRERSERGECGERGVRRARRSAGYVDTAFKAGARALTVPPQQSTPSAFNSSSIPSIPMTYTFRSAGRFRTCFRYTADA